MACLAEDAAEEAPADLSISDFARVFVWNEMPARFTSRLGADARYTFTPAGKRSIDRNRRAVKMVHCLAAGQTFQRL
jgi:hypothetical protein